LRFLTYEHNGDVKHGALDPADTSGQTVRELGTGDLLVVLEREGLTSASARVASAPAIDVDDVRIIPPMRRPPKLLAVAANYGAHVTNSGGEPVDPSQATPRLFLKPSTCIIAYDAPIELSPVVAAMDWEVELGVVIGRRCKNVGEDRALDQVAGYVSANDVSARTLDFGFERREQDVHPFFDWLAGKWFDGFAPLGPWLVSADEAGDPQDLALHLDVNGEIRQQGSTSEMIFSVAELISFASRLMTLEPGDTILTGTPAGAGVETGKVFLELGDIMTARVGALGAIRNTIIPPTG
jgi:2-keto-4-pentenoate hydratase/2-oxohepta-3-ene-1,7-dioic acid hydratase in catechol pathway